MLNLFVLMFFLVISSFANSQNNPLRVGVIPQTLPYAVQGSIHHFFGFDMAVIENSCLTLKRDCEYRRMSLPEAFKALKRREIDVALGILTMSDVAPAHIKFTIPYLLVRARIIGRNNRIKHIDHPYNFNFLYKKKVGIFAANNFVSDLSVVGVPTAKIVSFKNQHNLIASLSRRKIDFAILNEYSAKYWQRNSTGFLKIVGRPLRHPYKVRMMINADDQQLLEEINNSIIHYQNEGHFLADYRKYISSFEEFKT